MSVAVKDLKMSTADMPRWCSRSKNLVAGKKKRDFDQWRRVNEPCKNLGCKILPCQKGPFYDIDDVNRCADLKFNVCEKHAYRCSPGKLDAKGDYLCGKSCSMRDVENEGILTRCLNGYSYWYCSEKCFQNNCDFPTSCYTEYADSAGKLQACRCNR